MNIRLAAFIVGMITMFMGGLQIALPQHLIRRVSALLANFEESLPKSFLSAGWCRFMGVLLFVAGAIMVLMSIYATLPAPQL